MSEQDTEYQAAIQAAQGTLVHQGVRYAVTWEECPWCGREPADEREGRDPVG